MHPTDEITLTLTRRGEKPLTFTISDRLSRKVENLIKSSGETSAAVPAHQVFPALIDDVMRPATSMRGSRHKTGMTQVELAKHLGIRQAHLSEMENGKRPIGKNMAKKLARTFDCDYRVFL